MNTYADIVNEVLNFGFNDGPQVYRSRVKDWINEAQQRIARQVEGPEFQTNYSVVMVVGQASYPLPVDFARIQDLSYPLYGYRLQAIDIQDYDLVAYSQAAQASPQRYTLDQFNLLLWPYPASTDSLTMRYISVPPKLVGDGDVPVLNPNYWDLLVSYSARKAFEAEDDYEAAQYFSTQFKADLQSYASDVQWRNVDRPRVLDGTWGGRGR
jgi:hypothetical protein